MFAKNFLIVASLLVCAGSVAHASATSSPAKVSQEQADQMAEAIFKGESQKIQALKKKGVSLDVLSSSGTTGLMQLAEEGRLAEIKKTLALGAKTDIKNEEGETALFSALYSGHDDVASLLLSKGAKADHVTKTSKECALHAAVKAQLIGISKKLKTSAPKCLTQKNADGKTPADLARELGNSELAKILQP